MSALNVIAFDAGKEFEIVTLSVDPRETPQQATRYKKGYMDRYPRKTAAEGWHFLTGDSRSIEALTQAAGFRYAWDEDTKQYAHPAGIVVATPDGRIGQYLFGIEYAPRDLRFALVEASSGKIGTLVDQAILYCYKYDPATGRYGAAIMRILRVLAVLTLAALGTFVFVMLRRDARLAFGEPPREPLTLGAPVPLFPEQASTIAPEVDALYFYLVGVSVVFGLRHCARHRVLRLAVPPEAPRRGPGRNPRLDDPRDRVERHPVPAH